MKKLITNVNEIYAKFDSELKELEKTKLKSDAAIYKHEIAILKLVKCSMDRMKVFEEEKQLSDLINVLKHRKALLTAETQETRVYFSYVSLVIERK